MRFMLIMKANEDTERGTMPTESELSAMMDYNDQLAKAGILLAAEGLHASTRGSRVRFEDGKRTVTDGPFAETKELIAGFWIIQAASHEEAVEWVKRCPADGAVIEIRQVFEVDDFGDVASPELRDREGRLRSEAALRQHNA